ncbi:MAG TPA: alpha/beta hydrolase, partial [Chthoniobacterales bacterium]
WRAMVPLVPDKLPELKGAPVLLLAGDHDPIITPENVRRLSVLLERAGADVTLTFERAGHGLTEATIEGTRQWLGNLESPRATA